MNTNIQNHYERLCKYCARQFKDQNCEDTVGDFVVKVLTKENFYPDTIKDIHEEWAWTKSCFYRFKIDKLRSEKVRDKILHTYDLNGSDSTKQDERFAVKSSVYGNIAVPEVSHTLSDKAYLEYISFQFPDEILEIYLNFTDYEKRVFQLTTLCRYNVLETTKVLKESQSTTKHDVTLALKRIKESLRKNGGKDYDKYIPTELEMYSVHEQ